jgi:hypothetical protein
MAKVPEPKVEPTARSPLVPGEMVLIARFPVVVRRPPTSPPCHDGSHRMPQEGRSGWRPARDTLAAGRPVVSVVRVVAAVFSARAARPDRVGGVVRPAVVAGRSDQTWDGSPETPRPTP